MFRDYQADIQVDLCFQSFEEELAGLPGKYECVLLSEGGCVALRPFGDGSVELKRLFVYPSARGQGLGRVLVEEAIAWAKEKGYERMRLDTIAKKMPSAVALYQTLGFVQLPARGGMGGPDLLEMELELARFTAEEGDS